MTLRERRSATLKHYRQHGDMYNCLRCQQGRRIKENLRKLGRSNP